MDILQVELVEEEVASLSAGWRDTGDNKHLLISGKAVCCEWLLAGFRVSETPARGWLGAPLEGRQMCVGVLVKVTTPVSTTPGTSYVSTTPPPIGQSSELL